MNRQVRGFQMFDIQLTIGLSGVGNDIPTHLRKIRPTLTGIYHENCAYYFS